MTNERFLKEIANYLQMSKQRNEFIHEFFENNNIEGNEYYMGGNGACNHEFEERNKCNIYLAISDTENNVANFPNAFHKNKMCEGKLLKFKKNSKIMKDFQEECIKKHIVINLLRISPGEYFKELHLGGYSSGLEEDNGTYYLKVSTNKYDSITPEMDGFKEIKDSEYYKVTEKLVNYKIKI